MHPSACQHSLFYQMTPFPYFCNVLNEEMCCLCTHAYVHVCVCVCVCSCMHVCVCMCEVSVQNSSECILKQKTYGTCHGKLNFYRRIPWLFRAEERHRMDIRIELLVFPRSSLLRTDQYNRVPARHFVTRIPRNRLIVLRGIRQLPARTTAEHRADLCGKSAR